MPESGVFPGFFGGLDLKPDFWKSLVFLYGNISTTKCVSGCDLGLDVTIWDSGLDVRHFGMIFGKWKRMTTNPATRPFWVFAGSGLDVKRGYTTRKLHVKNPTTFSFMDMFPQTTKQRKRLWIYSLARKNSKDIQPIVSSHVEAVVLLPWQAVRF